MGGKALDDSRAGKSAIELLRKKGNWNRVLPWLMLAVSLTGFCICDVIPFLVSFAYSVVDSPIHGKFCGLQNYVELFRNPYFFRGLKNTVKFMAISIPLNMILSFWAAWLMHSMKQNSGFLILIFLIPLTIPSATAAFFWENFLGLHGAWNQFLSIFGIRGIDWFDSRYSMLVIVILFLWKNIGYNMTLFLSGLGNIPKQYYEYAEVEGAGRMWKFKHITWVYLTPTSFLVLIMTFVNSFKVFKEIYLITGEYPPDGLYVLQHYMNNMFLSLNYPRLAGAVYILTIAVVVFVTGLFRAEARLSENLRDESL